MTEPTIHTALLAFHKDATSENLDLGKNRSGHTNEYLDLDKSMDQIRPLLAKHDLFVRHETTGGKEDGYAVRTVVCHGPSGEELSSGWFPLEPTKRDMQGWGAADTYGRRYTLMNVLALVADNDDDAGGSTRRQKASAPSPGKITAKQRNDLMAAIRAAKLSTDQAQAIVKDVAGVEASADIPRGKAEEVIEAIKAAAA